MSKADTDATEDTDDVTFDDLPFETGARIETPDQTLLVTGEGQYDGQVCFEDSSGEAFSLAPYIVQDALDSGDMEVAKTTVDCLRDALDDLDWVALVQDIRDQKLATFDADVRIVTRSRIVRTNYEQHTIENAGVTVTAVGDSADYGRTIYGEF
jgi:hypothetical protein